MGDKSETTQARLPGTAREKEALIEMQHYCRAHPSSPAAKQRPRIFVRGDRFIAIASDLRRDAITGMGETVRAALEAFDHQSRVARAPTPRA